MTIGNVQNGMGSDRHDVEIPGQGEIFQIPRQMGQQGPDKLIESDQTVNVLARTNIKEKQLFQMARVILRKHAILYGNTDLESVYQFIMQGSPSVNGKSREQYIEAYKAQSMTARRGFLGRAQNMGRAEGNFQ